MTAFELFKQLPSNVTFEMLNPEFWLERIPNPDDVLQTPETIANFNRCVHATLEIPDFRDLPTVLSAESILQQIGMYQQPSRTRYGAAGQELDDAYFAALLNNANPPIAGNVPLLYGLVTERTQLRTFPTSEVATAQPLEFAFDRFQETAVDIGWPVAILTASRDGQWYFCLSPLYWGWLPQAHVAIAPREMVIDYVDTQPFVVTTANRGLVATRNDDGVNPQMGTRLPLIEETATLWRVQVPMRNPDGTLQLVEGTINPSAGQFSIGYQPLTLRNVLNYAFSLLGESYAWGCSRLGIFGRDCSRFVKDSYAPTGVIWPRNGNEQATVGAKQVIFTDDMTETQRKQLLVEQATPGALLELDGHIMMYIGHINGEPYVIHDTARQPWSCVLVSDLSAGAGSENGSLLQQLNVAVIVGVENGKA
ncbi:MAG: SH3 domain-containing protein [Chloroflexi bacterium]|nr:SH3 domain-containing protein [Chloroflexota bacterium]